MCQRHRARNGVFCEVLEAMIGGGWGGVSEFIPHGHSIQRISEWLSGTGLMCGNLWDIY